MVPYLLIAQSAIKSSALIFNVLCYVHAWLLFTGLSQEVRSCWELNKHFLWDFSEWQLESRKDIVFMCGSPIVRKLRICVQRRVQEITAMVLCGSFHRRISLMVLPAYSRPVRIHRY